MFANGTRPRWGCNVAGQLGNGMVGHHTTPMPVAGFGGDPIFSDGFE
ncbi:MAG: hypothetical protein IT477_01235 [Rhodanobacteraceae bacterium]|nr:hypothetical protein [Rhodanobacteraceae bacterium]